MAEVWSKNERKTPIIGNFEHKHLIRLSLAGVDIRRKRLYRLLVLARFKLICRSRFSIGHGVFSAEPGEATTVVVPNPGIKYQGHNYILDVCVTAPRLAKGEMIINSQILRELIRNEVVNELDGSHFDVIEDLQKYKPSAEAILVLCRNRLSLRMPQGIDLDWLSLREGSETHLQIERNKNMLKTVIRTDFSAAHRLHSADLSDDENKKLFGKCNNPSGHGHNYGLEVTIESSLDARTGTVADLPLLKELVKGVADRFDHKHLNEDCEEFRDVNPTAENVCRIIYGLLKKQMTSGKLIRVAVQETEKSIFEYEE